MSEYMIRIQDLHKYFGDLEVLKGVDMDERGSPDWDVAVGAELAKGGAYRLESNVPVTVYQFSALS